MVTLNPSFLVPGGLLALLGLKINRGVHFLTTFVVVSVGIHMALRPLPGMFQFDVGADVIAALPWLAAVLGLIAAALLIPLQFIGRFTLGLVAATLLATLVLCDGALLPAAGWGEALMDQLQRTVGVVPAAPADAVAIVAPTNVIPVLDMDGVPVVGLTAFIASFVALGVGLAGGVLTAVGNWRVEAVYHALLGAVLAGFGLGHLWAIGAVLAVGTGVQWWINRPDKGSTPEDHEERATQMWKHVQAAGQIPGDDR